VDSLPLGRHHPTTRVRLVREVLAFPPLRTIAATPATFPPADAEMATGMIRWRSVSCRNNCSACIAEERLPPRQNDHSTSRRVLRNAKECICAANAAAPSQPGPARGETHRSLRRVFSRPSPASRGFVFTNQFVVSTLRFSSAASLGALSRAMRAGLHPAIDHLRGPRVTPIDRAERTCGFCVVRAGAPRPAF
jgi:hypothetical protein